MTVTDFPPEVDAYLAAVRSALSDLPASERDDLLAEVEASLRDAAEEGGAIGARLGSPAEFAAELRTAAGLHELPAAKSRRLLLDTLSLDALLFEPVRRLRAHRAVVALRGIARELAPVWWVARGYLVVAGVGAVTHSVTWSTRYPAVPRLGTAEAGIAAVLLVTVASVTLGLRARRGAPVWRRAALAASLVGVALIVPVADHLSDSSVATVVVTVSEPVTPPGLTYDGVPVQNIYPYSRDGKLLHDVLLYDGAGRPIDIGAGVADPNRRLLRTTANTSVFNSFPIRYYEPGTVHVAHRNAGPPVKTPRILPEH